MKRIFLILILTMQIMGCESANKITSGKIGTQKFPKALVGVWEGYYSKVHWVVKFTPDGSIEYAKIPFGGKFVAPNSEAAFPMEGDNNKMVIKTGRWTAGYASDGTLSAAIEIVNADAMMPVGRIEMKGTEYLIGKVDLDKGEWSAIWITDGNYSVTPLRGKRIELPYEDDGGNPMILKRLIRKDSTNLLR
jgi:hypothetical protein